MHLPTARLLTRSPLFNGVITGALYALVVRVVWADSLVPHTLEIIAIAVGAYVSTALARRRARKDNLQR